MSGNTPLKFPCNVCWRTECAGSQCPAQDSEMRKVYEDRLLKKIENELPTLEEIEDLDCISLQRGYKQLKMIQRDFYLEEQFS